MGKKKKFIIIGIIVVVVLFIIARVAGNVMTPPAENTADKVSYIPVSAVTVEKQTIATTITLSGKVQADSEVMIMPKTPGKVESLAVKVGDSVEKNQVLFSLEKTDMLSSYNQAAAQLKMAEANYQSTKEKIDNAKLQLERYQELYEIGAVSKAELEQMEIQASDANLLAVEAQLEQAQAGFQKAENALNDMDVKSPISGIVTSLDIGAGDMVSNASPAATVVSMDRVYVNVSVSEKEINNIQEGQEVKVNVSSASKTNIKGTIDSLSLAADARTGKYSLKVYIDNKDHVIKPGMFAQVKIDTNTKNDVLVVPTDAVSYHGGQYVAYVIDDGKAVEKEVITGLDNGKETEIVSGLEEGEILIVKGQNYVNQDSEVKIVELDGEKVQEPAEETQAEETQAQAGEEPQDEENPKDSGEKASQGGTKQ